VAEDAIPPDQVFWNAARKPCPVYLWGDGEGDKGRYSIVAHTPRAVLAARGDRTILSVGDRTCVLEGSPLAHLECIACECAVSAEGLPFQGGLIGFVTYEQACADLIPGHPSGPLPGLCFGLYDSAYVFDHRLGKGYWVGAVGEPCTQPPPRAQLQISGWQASVSREQYLAHVEQILNHIAAGDLYQANYTQRWTAEGNVDGPALALEFRRALPSPLGAYLGFPEAQIWSLSPERLLSGRRGACLESRPIKGTRPRDADPERDLALSLELAGHPKDRAELLMIVDLVRNDLGKVATPGSVRVDELYGRRSYSNVHHLEAIVRSDFPPAVGWAEALAAVLPGGSVTGAPKRSAVQLLARLEPAPRSVYTGAIGYISYHGTADFNLPIRTLYHDGRRFYLHSGGGIVADSQPEAEYQESLLKVSHIVRLLSAL
jgi:para-aminobenzoate synthetase component I